MSDIAQSANGDTSCYTRLRIIGHRIYDQIGYMVNSVVLQTEAEYGKTTRIYGQFLVDKPWTIYPISSVLRPYGSLRSIKKRDLVAGMSLHVRTTGARIRSVPLLTSQCSPSVRISLLFVQGGDIEEV